MTDAQKKTIERLAAEGVASEAVRRWEDARRFASDALATAGMLENVAINALAALRPGKSLTLNGKKYVAVTSRGHVDVRPIAKKVKKRATDP
jgi:hypothetical protein